MEIGIPFSDPVMDGPVIQQASQASLDLGTTRVRGIVGRHDVDVLFLVPHVVGVGHAVVGREIGRLTVQRVEGGLEVRNHRELGAGVSLEGPDVGHQLGTVTQRVVSSALWSPGNIEAV